ncbi:riboflavin synthase [Parvularcula sp. IMCC14364]|uniref:riboflavin synthase n=1 Tax=Parvularcula sp. IMCC14364 TaxID=3067902 RepID=UPI002741AE91|nr:riboflavin synthase [Parvularcula sp. IMCC14364]
MFTGLIEEIGQIADISQTDGKYTLAISANTVLQDVAIGDSIAVNGVCLTVTRHTHELFTVDAVPETLARTNLGDLVTGGRVNLERSATPDTRLGGHYVQGHVDTTGVIDSFRQDSEAIWVTIKTDPAVMKYIVTKGYITIDGTSLTVVDVGPDWFNITLIPHTQEHITLPGKSAGDRVNLETDIIAKYVEKLLGTAMPIQAQGDHHAIS